MKKKVICILLIVLSTLSLQAQTSKVDKGLISFFTIVNGERRYGFADETGRIMVSAVYKTVKEFREGMAAVQNAQGKWGYVNSAGRLIVTCKYKEAGDFYEGLGCVRDNNDKYSFINKSGGVVFTLRGDLTPYFGDFHEGLARVQDNNLRDGFVDKTGKLVIPCTLPGAMKFQEGLAAICDKDTKVGYIDKTGKVVIPCQYKMKGLGVNDNFHEGVARVMNNGKYGFIDKTGKVVIPFKWEMAYPFSEGLALVQNDSGKYGYIDKTGKVIIPFEWIVAKPFSNGLAKVENTKGISYIDKTGKVILSDPKWDWNESKDFHNDCTIVHYNGSNPYYAFIDKTGKTLAMSESRRDVGWELQNGYFKRLLVVGDLYIPQIINNKKVSVTVH